MDDVRIEHDVSSAELEQYLRLDLGGDVLRLSVQQADLLVRQLRLKPSFVAQASVDHRSVRRPPVNHVWVEQLRPHGCPAAGAGRGPHRNWVRCVCTCHLRLLPSQKRMHPA